MPKSILNKRVQVSVKCLKDSQAARELSFSVLDDLLHRFVCFLVSRLNASIMKKDMPVPALSHVMRYALHDVLYLELATSATRIKKGGNSNAAVLRTALPTGSVTTESKGVAVLTVR